MKFHAFICLLTKWSMYRILYISLLLASLSDIISYNLIYSYLLTE
jgi:hypothetical protein